MKGWFPVNQKQLKTHWNRMKARLAAEEDVRRGLTCGASQMRKGTATVNLGGILIIHNEKGLVGRPDSRITTKEDVASFENEMRETVDWLTSTDAVREFMDKVGAYPCTVEYKHYGRKVRDLYGRWHDMGTSCYDCYMRFNYPPVIE